MLKSQYRTGARTKQCVDCLVQIEPFNEVCNETFITVTIDDRAFDVDIGAKNHLYSRKIYVNEIR